MIADVLFANDPWWVEAVVIVGAVGLYGGMVVRVLKRDIFGRRRS